MINELTPKNLYDIWSSELECIKILDFRSLEEYMECRVPGAKSFINRPLDKDLFLASENISFFLLEAPESFYKSLVSDQSITNVFIIEGGFKAWIDQGYPTAPLKFNSKEVKYD